MIPVSKPYLPSREKLNKYIDSIYERQWFTNNGTLVQELTKRLEAYLGVENLLLVANGTLALQIAYRSLGITKALNGKPAQAITTPFTFIATASSLKWSGVQPVFADINSKTWCLAPENIEEEINPQTKAIVPVHVFGNACEVEAIESIARKNKLKVIYDASHAFAVTYKGKSILKHGDAATLSFHATKLFHTGEGGAIIFKRKNDLERAKKIINFGIADSGNIEELGVNAKMNELQAALGLCVLDEIEVNLQAREKVWRHYEQTLSPHLQLQEKNESIRYNYSYFPVLFESEVQAVHILSRLRENGILARRYFYPSLESVRFCFGSQAKQPVSRDIASRILCLPNYATLPTKAQHTVLKIISDSLAYR